MIAAFDTEGKEFGKAFSRKAICGRSYDASSKGKQGGMVSEVWIVTKQSRCESEAALLPASKRQSAPRQRI